MCFEMEGGCIDESVWFVFGSPLRVAEVVDVRLSVFLLVDFELVESICF